MLHLPIVIEARNCNMRNRSTLNYLNSVGNSSTIVGVTSACTIFIVPHWLIPNSNFLEELKRIDSDRRKICYGVNIHILRSQQGIVLFLRQMRFAVVVKCIWRFSGKLFYCNPIDSQLLFVYQHRKACTNLIQFEMGFSFFCAKSDNVFEKITYFNNVRHEKLIRTQSASLFLKENSNIVLIINDTSNRAGFYEINIFDDAYVEQLANSEIKGEVIVGLLESRKYVVNFLEKTLGNASSPSQDLSNYITMHQTTANELEWYCIARFDERYEVVDNEVRSNYDITAVILMIPILSVLLAAATFII
uniref:DUF4793 domain-containing protein n=1 Tax=Elaeophora elaphi TaxID=1147741 RepID=A0A0R3RVE1_9BILA